VADVEIAVRLRWKTGVNVLVLPGAKIVGNNVADKIGGSSLNGCRHRIAESSRRTRGTTTLGAFSENADRRNAKW